jgi:hypothetical protein
MKNAQPNPWSSFRSMKNAQPMVVIQRDGQQQERVPPVVLSRGRPEAGGF